jgi:hypothetical protein
MKTKMKVMLIIHRLTTEIRDNDNGSDASKDIDDEVLGAKDIQ